MIDFTNARLEQLSVHYVGNKVNGEGVQLSDNPTSIINSRIRELVLDYVVGTFKTEEFFSFHFSTGEITLNPLFNFAKRIFTDQASFHRGSIDMAIHLHNQSLHPNIKPGEFFVALFSGVSLSGFQTEVLALFKSENKYPFIKVAQDSRDFNLQLEEGINMEKIDKGCIIFNVNEENGFQLAVADKSSKGNDAKFWKDDFLNIIPLNDNYHATKIVLDITKKYVTGPLTAEEEITKADQADMLNRSIAYFKSNEQYDKEAFEQQVLRDADRIEKFRQFEEQCREEMQIGVIDQFPISGSAVRQQQRHFKSVIKLDKNFHIYIHGNRDLIEQGVDEKRGKRYYKIYFDEEY